ncbi:MAG: C40 family peptidase [Spirochaetales bacterium]
MIGNRQKKKASFLAIALLLMSRLSFARETVSFGTTETEDIAAFLPPVRGLDFSEPRQDIPDKGPIAPEYASEQILKLIASALAWLGTPYLLGGFSKAGVDCSGFIHNILSSSIPELGPFPRRSEEYALIGAEAAAIEPGDILLFAQDKVIYHVGLALSSHTFIHSASEGARTGVIISSLGEGNWSARLFGVRRLGS